MSAKTEPNHKDITGVNFNEKGEEKQPFMIRVATFIVDRRNLFFLLLGIATIFSLISSGWVKVENSLAAYLPDTAETTIGLNRMEDEFITYGTSKVMVMNITYDDADRIAVQLPLEAVVLPVHRHHGIAAVFQLEGQAAVIEGINVKADAAHFGALCHIHAGVGIGRSAAGRERHQHGQCQDQTKQTFHRLLLIMIGFPYPYSDDFILHERGEDGKKVFQKPLFCKVAC